MLATVLLAVYKPQAVAPWPMEKSAPSSNLVPGKFIDLASTLSDHFQYISSHTSKKYLIETMGAGVALFDYGMTDVWTFS